MINKKTILNKVLHNIDPRLLSQYSQSRILVKGILRDFIQEVSTSASIYKAQPDMFYMTLKMNDSFMKKIPVNQRDTLIQDITRDVIAKLNNHLIKHPDRNNQQEFKIRPHIVIENMDFYGEQVMEHSHSILMMNPKVNHFSQYPYDITSLQFKLFEIHAISKPFRTITDDYEVHLLNDCHSIKVDYLAQSTDVEKVLEYDLKTCLRDDDDNKFTILNYNSQEKYYEQKNAKR